MNLNPADLLSTGREHTALDSITGFLAGLANAAQAHPVMTGLGLAGAAAVLYAARHLTHVSNDTARKTAAAYAATQAATVAVRMPGKLTPKAISDAAEVPRGYDYTKAPIAEPLPVPAARVIDADELPSAFADLLDGQTYGVGRAFRDTQVMDGDTMPAVLRG